MQLKRKFLRSGLLLLCLLAPLVVWRLLLGYDVNLRLAAIRAAGLPTNGRELDNWYAAVPDRENAALVLTQAFALRRNYADNRSNAVWNFKLPKRGETLTPKQNELLAGYVEMNSEALAKANEALKLPACRYPIDCSLCAQTPLPHLTWLVHLAEQNQYKAFLAIQAGNAKEASPCIETMLDLAGTLRKEPILISQLVRYKILRRAVETLERRINGGALGSGEAVDLRAGFGRSGVSNSLACALIGERAFYATYFRMAPGDAARIYSPIKDGDKEADSKSPIPRKRSLALRLIGFYDLDFGHFLFAMNTNIALASLPPPDNLRTDSMLARTGAAAKKHHRIVSGLFLSNLVGSAARENEVVAYLRMAAAALALEQFRNQNGRLPETLDELTPALLEEVPEDPFTGLDLQYRRLEKGYLIYSVGRDLQDDHGLEKSEKKTSLDRQSYDLTFRVER
jgi:hypothetical protein